jgi:hypothetical protein
METNFEYWRKGVLGNRVNIVKQTAPTAVFMFFEDGYACYVYSDTPLKFDHQAVVDHTNPTMEEKTVLAVTKGNYLHPAGAINCLLCHSELYYDGVRTDNPHDIVYGFCKKCRKKWCILVHSLTRRVEVWPYEGSKEENYDRDSLGDDLGHGQDIIAAGYTRAGDQWERSGVAP